MPALTLYMDTSVLGGYFDEEYREATRELWRLAQPGQYRFVTSVVTRQEVIRDPRYVLDLFAETFPDKSRHLPLTDRASELAEAYVNAGVVRSRK